MRVRVGVRVCMCACVCVCLYVTIVRTGHTFAKIKNEKMMFVDFNICCRRLIGKIVLRNVDLLSEDQRSESILFCSGGRP